MGKFEFYGTGLPGINLEDLKGHLIVLEGTDGVGRSTQVGLLRGWLESRGHAVLDTGMARSALAGKGIKKAKQGHTLGSITQNLFYATDFADRLENAMVPALRAGFVVLTDRYIYSLIARAIVRGANPDWIKDAYRFALKPDAIYYLRIGIDDLIPRVLHSSEFDYWESGMDMRLGDNLFTSFSKYQTRLLTEFDAMSEEYGFEVVDASKTIEEIYDHLKGRIRQLLQSGPARQAHPAPAPEGQVPL